MRHSTKQRPISDLSTLFDTPCITPEVLRVFSLGIIISTISKTLGSKAMYLVGKQCEDTNQHVQPTLPSLVTLLQEISERNNWKEMHAYIIRT